MSFLTPQRIDTEELLDEYAAPRPDVERSLRDLRRFNRYAGGISIYRRLLRRLLGPGSVNASVLDVGTGTSDLLDSLAGASRMRIGVDFKIDHLLYRPQPDRARIRRVAADAFRLPVRDGSVDVVTSSHFFHHFSPEENALVLEEALRVARVGVMVSDTRRHIAPLAFARLLAALRLVGRITRFDAPASVLRGYTMAEAKAVADRVRGTRKASVVKAFPFRFAILLWK
jgi:ubiquinone/menaquinone biosynthesis C-methylase UbiE